MEEEENNRQLTAKELQRVELVDKITVELSQKGYSRDDVTITIAKANKMALLWAIPFILIFGIWFIIRNGLNFDMSLMEDLSLVVLCLISIIIHELLHGLTWGILAPSHFKNIEFGFMKEVKTPYCTCKDPLKKGAYIIGSLMPFLILGVVPSIAGIYCNSFFWLVFGILSIMGAGGDLTIIWKMLQYKADTKDMIIMDHPSKCGFIVFKK